MQRDRSASRRRWTGPRVASLVVSLGLALSALAGCMSQGNAPSPAKRSGCGTCSSEVTALGEQVRSVSGVSEMKQIRYTERVAVTTPATLTVVVAGEDRTTLRDAVAKAAWLSEVDPLEDLSVGVLAPGAKYVVYHDYAFKRDADSYTKKWGARPASHGG